MRLPSQAIPFNKYTLKFYYDKNYLNIDNHTKIFQYSYKKSSIYLNLKVLIYIFLYKVFVFNTNAKYYF